MVTLSPLAFKSRPNEDAVIPFPRDETTPPVTKINFVISLSPSLNLPRDPNLLACQHRWNHKAYKRHKWEHRNKGAAAAPIFPSPPNRSTPISQIDSNGFWGKRKYPNVCKSAKLPSHRALEKESWFEKNKWPATGHPK